LQAGVFVEPAAGEREQVAKNTCGIAASNVLHSFPPLRTSFLENLFVCHQAARRLRQANALARKLRAKTDVKSATFARTSARRNAVFQAQRASAAAQNSRLLHPKKKFPARVNVQPIAG